MSHLWLDYAVLLSKSSTPIYLNSTWISLQNYPNFIMHGPVYRLAVAYKLYLNCVRYKVYKNSNKLEQNHTMHDMQCNKHLTLLYSMEVNTSSQFVSGGIHSRPEDIDSRVAVSLSISSSTMCQSLENWFTPAEFWFSSAVQMKMYTCITRQHGNFEISLCLYHPIHSFINNVVGN